MKFPYEPREGQMELMDFIRENEGYLLVNAPTGFGKTPAVLYPLLEKGEQVIWAVRTGNETDRPIEELKKIGGAFGFSLRGKRDMCLLAKDYGSMDSDEVQFLCTKKKKECPYYKNLMDEDVFDLTYKPLLYSEILNIAKERKICPYYLQFQLIDLAQVLSLSYNYILNKSLIWILRKRFNLKETTLVVDEAHNLQRMVMNLNHDEITSGSVERAMSEISEFSGHRAKEIWEFLNDLRMRFSTYTRKREINVDIIDFVDIGIISDLKRYGTMVRSRKLKKGKRPASSLAHIARFFDESLDMMDEGVFFILRREKKRIVLERWDARASEIFSEIWKLFGNVIFMSGTLKPFDAFMDIAGIEDAHKFDFSGFYNLSKIRVEIRDEMSTRGDTLPSNMAKKYVKDIAKFAENNFNIAVFSASYRVQNSLIKNGIIPSLENLGREVFVEEEGMPGDVGREILEDFKKASPKGVLLGTASGRFAEGADFPGESLVGVYLVGIPFERVTLKTKLFLDYYKKVYGHRGRYYGYVIPALRTASQALGRALRSREDRGYFILGDKRYRFPRYFNLLPGYIRNAYLSSFESLKGNGKF